MRGRKPKPTHLKLVEGNRGKRSISKEEPKPPVDRDPPPEHLSEIARAEWMRMAPELRRKGLLTVYDRAALAGYCEAYARWVDAEKALQQMAKMDRVFAGLVVKTAKGNAIQNPLVGVANRAMELMLRAAAEFGMTPSARTRVNGEHGEAEDDPADKYFA